MRQSSDKNESAHKQFKQLVSNTNRHMGSIASQLLSCWVDRFDYSSMLINVNTNSDDDGCTQGSTEIQYIDFQLWTQSFTKARDAVSSAT